MNKRYGFANRDLKFITYFLIMTLLFGLVLSFNNVAEASQNDDQENMNEDSTDPVETNGGDLEADPDKPDETDGGLIPAGEVDNEPEEEVDRQADEEVAVEIESNLITYSAGALGPRPMNFNILTNNDGPGSLTLDKWAEPVPGTNNRWKVTLSLMGEDIQRTSDIVLVIDKSGSMQGDKMTQAKTAAKKFVDDLLKENGNTRIALVHYSTTVSVYDSTNPFKNHNSKQALKNAIDGLSASGGTHTQAGIRQARNLLAGSVADSKNIVLLSDGEPTYSYALSNTSLNSGNFTTSGTNRYSRDDLPQSRFNYSSRAGAGSAMTTYIGGSGLLGLSSPYRYYHHGNSAVAESRFAKASGYTIYTIALSAGTDGNDVLNKIADPGKAFTGSSSDLQAIFNEVAGDISLAATDAVITDKLGDMFTLVDPPGISVSAGTADYDLGSKTITWQLGTISQSNPNTNPATMSYTVQISEDAESGVLYPTNEEAFVDYKNVFDEDSKQYFPIPEVMIEIEDITIRKLVSGNFGDRSREFPFDVTVTSSIEGYPKNYNFDLSHEGEFILYKLPKDAVIKLKETNAFGHSVIVTATGINGTIGSDENGIYTVIVADLTGDKTITVTNQNDVIIDTGISLDSLPYIIILALVAAGIAVLIIRRRKLSSED